MTHIMLSHFKPLLRALFSALFALAAASGHAQPKPLNDTGQTLCYNAANAPVACSAAVGGDAGVNPRQDARYGRDAQAAAGQLTKIGAGAAGFDYSKIANSGSTLAASAALGAAATDWACTKDNVTGLIWEIKTTSGLRSVYHTYFWYSSNAATNGGNVGALGTDSCGGTLAAYSNQCNTQNYVAAVNAAALCGATDWRLPSRRELLTIVHAGATNPSIDGTYFPNASATDSNWTSATYTADPANAWVVYPGDGYGNAVNKSSVTYGVRLVRGGQ